MFAGLRLKSAIRMISPDTQPKIGLQKLPKLAHRNSQGGHLIYFLKRKETMARKLYPQYSTNGMPRRFKLIIFLYITEKKLIVFLYSFVGCDSFSLREEFLF